MPYKKFEKDDGIIFEAFGILNNTDVIELNLDWPRTKRKSKVPFG